MASKRTSRLQSGNGPFGTILKKRAAANEFTILQPMRAVADIGIDPLQLFTKPCHSETDELSQVVTMPGVCLLQHAKVLISMAIEIIRKRIEAMSVVAAAEEDGGLDAARRAAVAVAERMQRDKIEMGQQGLHNRRKRIAFDGRRAMHGPHDVEFLQILLPVLRQK